MIIKSLLFIIICIFVYETYKTMLKMTEEYFTVGNTNFINNETNNDTEYNKLDTPYYKSFKPLEKEKEKEKDKDKETDKKDEYSPNYWNRNSLDTIYYKSFKPFEYNKNRAYYWRRDKLVEEGIRRNQDDLKGVVDLLESHDSTTNVITGTTARRSPYFNLVELDEIGRVYLSGKRQNDVKAIVRRQDAPQCFDMNASIYAWWRESLLNTTDHVIQFGTRLYLMPEERSVDIDSELDFRWVEFLMNNE